MEHFKYIYSHQAAAYHRLILPEDVDGHLLPALEQVTTFHNKRILDLGTGTGRLPLLLADRAAAIVGLDLHAAMLRENQRQRRQAQGEWSLLRGDMRALPLPTAWAEVVTAGWSIGHTTGWYPEREAWQTQIGRILAEMHRTTAPGGALIIIETLTTGSLEPRPPTPVLADYYAWLEQHWGFTRQEIRTDYQFESVAEAIAHTEFFFGQELTAAIREQGWSRLPEWTGVWAKQV